MKRGENDMKCELQRKGVDAFFGTGIYTFVLTLSQVTRRRQNKIWAGRKKKGENEMNNR